jgi:hypothetical protein
MATLLERYGGRPFLVALAAINAITGLSAAAILAPLSFGTDALAFRDGAKAIASGTFDVDFLYSPLAGIVARPLTWLQPEAAAALMTAIGLAILVVGVAVETRGLALLDRGLILVAAATFIPVVNELLLGQVTLVFAAALWLITRRGDALAAGVPLGIVLALAPKPLLSVVLVWMLVRRRRALLGTLVAAALTAAIGLVLAGLDLHRQWVDVLVHTGSVSRNGNVSLWATGTDPIHVLFAVGVIGVAVATLLRDDEAGFVAALFAGLLLAPYTLLYAATILLVGVRPALRISPLATRALTIVANPAVIAAFSIWCLTGLATAAWSTLRKPPPQ